MKISFVTAIEVIHYFLFFQDEKRVKTRNPGFEGIKKWLEVFLLNGVVDGSVSQKWRAPAAEVETENGSHLQLSTLIVEELKKLKSFYVNIEV